MSITAHAETFSVQYIEAEDISTAASLIYQAYHDDPVLKTMLSYDETNKSAYEKSYAH